MDVSPSGSGIVEVNETTPSSYPSASTFSNGTSVQLRAVSAPDYVFGNWSGDLSGTTNPAATVIDCNKKITANFLRIMHTTLTIEVNGSGSTSPVVGNHSYEEGTAVGIIANPDIGWQFDSWAGDVAGPDSPNTIVVMDSAKTITANFSKTMPYWWIISGAIAGIAIIGAIIWFVITGRTA